MSDDDSGFAGKFLKWGFYLLLIGICPPLFLPLILFYKYVKLCVIFYFKMLYLLIRFPIWLFIQLPLHYIGVGIHGISNAFSKAYALIVTKKKRYGLLFGTIFLLSLYSFLPQNTDAVLSFLTDATLILPLIFFIPFLVTFVVAFISAHLSMPDVAQKEMPGGLNTGTKQRTAEAAAAAGAAAQTGAKAAETGMKAYNKKDEIKAAAKGGKSLAKAAAGSSLPGDMIAVLSEMPVLGTMVSGAGATTGAAGSAISIAGASSGGVLILAFIAVILLGLLGFIIISAIISGFLWGTLIWLTGVLSPLISPILGAIGLSQAYGNWIGSEVANSFLPQVNLEAERRMVQQAGAKVGCFLKGPSCIRQWRLNHTSRPGSEDVGEKYRLKVEQFSAGGAGGIDIAYKRKEYNIPVSFLLINTRHGLKGIDARGVKYRVKIIDSKRTGKYAYCSTGWKDVSDSTGDGTILPGTSFSPVVTNLESLTLEKCEMLQPALGHDYTGKLDVKYNYSSQSTLYMQAMSRKNMRSQEIIPSFKKSKTADTPVETYINAKTPITFVNRDGTYTATPFTVKVGTHTDRLDVEYNIHPDEFEIIDSFKTEHQSDAACIGMEKVSGEPNKYQLSERAKERINARIEKNDLSTWFDKAKNPSPARCTFILKNPRSISPTGETLTFRIDANYTVNIEETSDPFEVQNTRCSQFECPILFYLSSSEFKSITSSNYPPQTWIKQGSLYEFTDPYRKWKQALCDGIDAGNGCAATSNYQTSYTTSSDSSSSEGSSPPSIGTPSQSSDSGSSGSTIKTQSIEKGELAVQWSENTAKANKIFTCSLQANPGQIEKEVVGISWEKLGTVVNGPDYKRLSYNGDDFEVIKYEKQISDKSGIPYIAEVKVTSTLRADNCKDGSQGLKPEYEVVSGDVSFKGAVGYAADLGGYLAPGS